MSLFQKIFLFAFLFILNKNVTAQIDSTYVPFPTDSVAWNETGCGWDGTFVNCSGNFNFITGDSILIDSIAYTTLYFGKTIFDTSNAEMLGGFREENKKIYFNRIGNLSSQEVLFYDFSVSIGDTVWHNMNGAYGVLQSIDTVILDDESSRRQYVFWENNYLQYQAQIIEGIGNINYGTGGLLHLFDPFFESSNRINCVITPNEIIYKTIDVTDHNCYDLSVPIKEIRTTDNIIYPNPFENSIYFKEKISNSKAIIYSISGQKMLEIELSNTNEINLSTLEKGIYFLHVLGAENFYTKIVKR